MMGSSLPGVLGRLATEALLAEAALAPKPGLVTPVSCGAHADMDFNLLVRSARTLEPWFTALAGAGCDAADEGCRPSEMLGRFRGIGVEAEQRMWAATGGINTHKGALFCLGLLSGAMGYLTRRNPMEPDLVVRACALVAAMCHGLVARDLGRAPLGRASHQGHPPTAGEKLYASLGVRGARGEAEEGYPLVLRIVVPCLREGRRGGAGWFEQACLQALLRSMAELEDSCLLHRGGVQALARVHREARAVLALGGAYTREGREAIGALDRNLSRARLSPGGSADMLAAGIFLIRVEGLLEGGIPGSIPMSREREMALQERLPADPQGVRKAIPEGPLGMLN